MAQTTSLVFNGGVIPSPSPAPGGSGKAKLLKIGEITVTKQEVQVTKNVICDPDSVTTVAPFMEVLTSAKLAELVNGNSILVLDDGTNQYLMSDANIVVEDGTAVCTSVNFLGLSRENRARTLYPCTRLTDELTLQQVVEVGEPVETGFNLVVAYPEDTEPGTLIDKLEIVDNLRDPDDPYDPPLLQLQRTLDEQGNVRKVAINEDNLYKWLDDLDCGVHDIYDALGQMDLDSVPTAYMHSTLNQSAGDQDSTGTLVNVFALDSDLVGECFEFEQTTTIDDVPFGYVWIEPGTYIVNASITAQWVGDPRGTFIPKVGLVMGENFDFSQEQELVRQSTKIVTIQNRTKLTINITYDAGTPPMGFWVKSIQVVKLAGGMSQTNIVHDTTLTGQGSAGYPLGVNESAVAQSTLSSIRDLPDKSEGNMVLDDDSGTGKFNLANLAQKRDFGCFTVEDGNGKAIMAVLHGHLKTKNFDSETLPDEYAGQQKSSHFSITDEQLNEILAIINGHVRTKYFNSAKLPDEYAQNKKGTFPLTIEDEHGNIVLAIINGNIRTKYFNSAKHPEAESIETFFTESKNYGKSVGVFGGSLSVYSESETAKNLWRKYLDMDVTSYGIAGAGFSSLQSPSTSIQKQVDSADVKDVYILWASTNDFSNNREIGSYTDYTYLDNYDVSKLETQCGGINYCLKKLYEKNPLCEIYFFTGVDFFSSQSGYNPFTHTTNALGYTYQDYVNAQKKCCELFSIPVLDQNAICGLNYFNYTNYFKSDNVHMKNAGYAKIAYQQLQFLANGLA